ncbi:hypothetical protein [Prosthecodimorpha staleyi]|uniref:Uncharacterized protein n=1 Tax=Prosthecodimorpha staleyi TaxID=2840188 RepID=A0A947D1R2_9HYPH|nr:hypothetical protein [Prosthecodimorpha staleyi]MBT9288683.1 hypothetical protein [Prosthecodimorpha staleyi]
MNIIFPCFTNIERIFSIQCAPIDAWNLQYKFEADKYISQITLPDRPILKPIFRFKQNVDRSAFSGEGLYIILSDRYPVYYIGQSTNGLKNRLYTHVVKMLGLNAGHSVNHTSGWRPFALKRYIFEARHDALSDIWISFTHIKAAKNYERSAWTQLNDFIASRSNINPNEHFKLTTTTSGNEMCHCTFPDNITNIIDNWSKLENRNIQS